MEAVNTKSKLTGYWVATSLLCLCILPGGIGQLFQLKWQVDGLLHLGYPLYFLSLVGFWKIMGTIALLVPRFKLLKEWAYAGIIFTMTGASVSHIAVGDTVFHIIVPIIIAAIAVLSWFLRPASCKLTKFQQPLK